MELGGDGELIARLIGDAARLREQLRGICVHAAQNTLLFLAIVAIMLVLAPRMGVFFLAGGLIAAAIGYRASLSAAKSAGRKQAHEGAYAAAIDAALARGNLALVAEFEGLEVVEDDELIGTSFFDAPTLHIHAVLAVTVVVVEFFLAFAIFVRRWRACVVPIGLALHAAFYVLLPVSTYSATMMVLYLALLDPDEVHRFIDRLLGHGDAAYRL